jgi:glycosyltransferase involved in cell wall biosynthesis
VEDYLRSKLFCGKHKAVTINKGHDVHWYDNNPPTNLHKEFGIPVDAFVLVNIANNRRMKGIPYLLKALNSLPEEANIHLLLVGRDMDTSENLAILQKGKTANRVHFTGFRNDVLNIVAASDVFVLPSIKGESITKSVIESMSLGTPAIISDIPGNIELVEDGVSGLVFPSKNSNALSVAILKLYNDREFCNKLGINARKHIAENLSNTQTIEKTAQLYNFLFNN